MRFQNWVGHWMTVCFGATIAQDKRERRFRFLEESLELCQSGRDCCITREEAHRLVNYVFDRPVGQTYQEVGGVMVTLAALCNAEHLNMADEGQRELMRCYENIDNIRAKQAAKKDKGGALP
jgi:hypothetical protein